LVRPILNKWHPHSSKATFWLPTFFVLFSLTSILGAIFFNKILLLPLLVYVFMVFVDASFKNKNVIIGFLAIIALFIQFFGYGFGFVKSTFYTNILKRDPEKQFPYLFFN